MSTYVLPKAPATEITRRLMPLGLGRRPRLMQAINAIITMIGRVHTAPRNFEQRANGQRKGDRPEDQPGFVLDRRALSGPKAPIECVNAKVTENLAREATRMLLDAGIIERITPTVVVATTDKTHRTGWWVKARKKDGEIRAPAIRYKLTAKLASLFSKTSKPPEPGQRAQVKTPRPPVGKKPTSQDYKGDGEGRVSTGGSAQAQPYVLPQPRPPQPHVPPQPRSRPHQSGPSLLSPWAMAIFDRPPKRF